MFTPKQQIAGMLIIIMFCSQLALGTTKTDVETKINNVTVYTDRARVVRTANVELTEGDHSILIEGLPPGAVDDSYRASLSGLSGLTLLGLTHRIEKHLESPHKQVAELEREIKKISSAEKQAVTDRLEAFNSQKKFLKAITDQAGDRVTSQTENNSIDIAQWNGAFRFVGDRYREVDDSIRVANKDLEDIERRLRERRHELNSLKSKKEKVTKTVQIDLRLEQAGEVAISLEYIIHGVKWKPLYDARLQENGHTVKLTCHVEINQWTGEDWNDVDLTLSTVQPSYGVGPGHLNPWYLATMGNLFEYKTRPVQTVDALLAQVAGVQSTGEGQVFIRGGRANEVSYIVDGVPIGDPLGSGAIGSNMSLVSGSIQLSSSYTTIFKTSRKETITSGGEAVRTTVARWELEGSPELITRPKNRESVYRLISLTNQEESPLLRGKVSVFVGTEYVGSTFLERVIAPGEEFHISFGIHNGIGVTRKVHSYTDRRKRNKVKVAQTIEIVLTNHSSKTEFVRVEEVIPVSKDSGVKIKIGKILPEPEPNKTKGKLVWSVKLEQGKEIKFLIPYKIEYKAGTMLRGM